MATVIEFPRRRQTANIAHSLTLEMRVAELSKAHVPADRRNVLGRLLGQYAKAVGPTPKRGAKRMFEQAGLMACYDKRKRFIVLEGETPALKPRSAWAEYFRLAKAAAALRWPNDNIRRASVEATYIRKLVAAGCDSNTDLLETGMRDISSLMATCAQRILSRVHAEVPELERARRLALVAPAHLGNLSCTVDIPIGALEWNVPIDVFRFPDDLVRKCPRILLGGDLWWQDPDNDEQASIFSDWLSQFQSAIGLPEISYDHELGYGWSHETVKAYEAVSLSIRTAPRLAAAALGLIDPRDAWEVSIDLEGLLPFQPVLSGRGSTEHSPYVADVIASRYVDCYRKDDFTLPVDDLWGTGFAVCHCVEVAVRQSLASNPRPRAQPFLIDANDPILRALSVPKTHALFDGRQDVETWALQVMRSDWLGMPPRFIPSFVADDNEPVPAADHSFVAAILRNMQHAAPGERLDDLSVGCAKTRAEEVMQELAAEAALIEQYQDGLAEW